MRRNLWIGWLVAQAALVAGLAIALGSRRMPLGVRGEWEWLRIDVRPDVLSVLIAGLFVSGYALYAMAGLAKIAKGRPATAWLIGLVPASILVQAGIQEAAPLGYGLVKSAVALVNTGSSGYYAVAKDQISDLGPFLAAYPTWIKGQDALHVGTHPPGLFVVARALLRLMETHPKWASTIVEALPKTFAIAFQSASASRPLPVADRAALATTGLLTLMACAATVVPLYWLARSKLSAPASWVAACLWPMVPAALMFQPTADTAFPLISTAALAAAGWAGRRPGLAIVAGLLLGIGTEFTLAFFPVGLVVAIVYLSESGVGRRTRFGLIVLTGVGFLAVALGFWGLTTANPFSIWQSNAANHARFYEQFHRSYLAWVVANPIELTIAIGLPTAVWALAGLRKAPTVSLATIGVLFLLTVSGKNLSEVARLWLPMMPPLLLMAGVGFERFAIRPQAIAATIAMLGVETLVLQAMIQVVYPV